MEAKQLMIGNLFYRVNRTGKVHIPDEVPLKIMGVMLDGAYYINADQKPSEVESYNAIDVNDIAPIPITPEWLTRAGFVKDFNSYIKLFFVESINRKGIIRIGTKECGHVDGFYYYDVVHEPKIKIEHVHQLQNLVKCLTGVELEFK